MKRVVATTIKKNLVSSGQVAICDDLIIEIMKDSGESHVYRNKNTNEWHIVVDEKGGVFFIGGVSIVFKKDGTWDIFAITKDHPDLDRATKKEQLHTTYGLDFTFRWYRYSLVQNRADQIKIGPRTFNLKKIGDTPIKAPGWGLDHITTNK